MRVLERGVRRPAADAQGLARGSVRASPSTPSSSTSPRRSTSLRWSTRRPAHPRQPRDAAAQPGQPASLPAGKAGPMADGSADVQNYHRTHVLHAPSPLGT